MANNKKNKSSVINNIENLNLEIDYDKLADAIVKAQQKAEKQKTKEQQTEKITSKLSFCDKLKLIWHIICNKVEFNGMITSAFLGSVMSIVFNLLAALLLIVLIFGVIAGIMALKDFEWSSNMIPTNIITISMFICFELFAATTSFTFRCIANEIAKEKDRNYIIAVFSGFVGFAALVVALVALLKGIL